MKVDQYKYPAGLYYDRHHSYARLEDDLVVQGITDLAEVENLLQESSPTLKEWAAKELEAHRLEKLRLDRALGLWPRKTAEPQWVEKRGRVAVPVPTPAPRAT